MSSRLIILYEKDPGVRFVFHRGLAPLEDSFEIKSIKDQSVVRVLVDRKPVALLIVEVAEPDGAGVALSRYVHENNPETSILWISRHDCQAVAEQKEALDIDRCLEKPLDIKAFQKIVRETLSAA
jgi:DNA-binding NtrC family response regulator